MAFNLHHPNPTKRIIYKILNTSAAETIKDIYNTDIVPPAELLHLIREIDRLKKKFISKHQHDPDKQQHHNERNIFFYLITKQERTLIENISLLLIQNTTVKSLIWLHDGIWLLPEPPPHVLTAIWRSILPDEEEPESLFRITPIISYVQKNPALCRIHGILQNLKLNNNRENTTWSKSVIKDSINKATKAKQIRDLTLANKKILITSCKSMPTCILNAFFKKKGLQL
jgi:hypothetical protein